METISADRETNVLAFRKNLELIRTVLAAQPYLGGETPAYADYTVFGCFQWARCISSFPLLLKDDAVWAWRDRLLSAFDGFAGKALLPARLSQRSGYQEIHEFCKGLSVCSRGHAVFYDRQWFHVYCFSDPADADKFLQRFGGEKFDPKQRGKGSNWARWNKP